MPIKIIEEKVCGDPIIFIDQVVFMIILRPLSFLLLYISSSIIRQIENGSVVRISNLLIVTKRGWERWDQNLYLLNSDLWMFCSLPFVCGRVPVELRKHKFQGLFLTWAPCKAQDPILFVILILFLLKRSSPPSVIWISCPSKPRSLHLPPPNSNCAIILHS